MIDENYKIPYGAHKGKKMVDIPASYLIYIWENHKPFGYVKDYIKENLETLKMQVCNENKGIK
jgi:uncharacterized protein (DUF3820 family)